MMEKILCNAMQPLFVVRLELLMPMVQFSEEHSLITFATRDPMPQMMKPAMRAGQLELCPTSPAETSAPAPMSSMPPPMIGPGADLCRNRPMPADTMKAAMDNGKPVRPASMGERPMKDCSQIDV